MQQMAKDNARLHTDFTVVGGYLSPVNARYAKLGLASSTHRINMCQLAVQDTSEWISVDAWEARQAEYTPTAQVLDHFDHELNTVRGGADCLVEDPVTGETRVEKKKIKIMLLAGSDLILTMSEPGVWAEKDVSCSGTRRASFGVEIGQRCSSKDTDRWTLRYSSTTSSVATAATSSNAPSPSSTNPSSPPPPSTRAPLSPCIAATFTWSVFISRFNVWPLTSTLHRYRAEPTGG